VLHANAHNRSVTRSNVGLGPSLARNIEVPVHETRLLIAGGVHSPHPAFTISLLRKKKQLSLRQGTRRFSRFPALTPCPIFVSYQLRKSGEKFLLGAFICISPI